MISYELSCELRDIGFPQMGNGHAIILNWPILESDETVTCIPWALYVHNPMPNHKVVYGPTLSELIEWCGEGLHCLVHTTNGGIDSNKDFWSAGKDEEVLGWYNATTPSEAVARLSIQIHKNHA